MNIQGAIDLETGTTCMLDVEAVNAASTIDLLEAIEKRFPKTRRITVIVDNPGAIAQSWWRRGFPGQDAGSGYASCHLIARI